MIEKLKFYSLIAIGVLIEIIIVSTIKHGGIDWMSIGRGTCVAGLLSFSYLLVRRETKIVEQKE